MHRRAGVAFAALVAATSLALAACADSGGAPAPSGDAEPIVIGTIGSYGGAQGSSISIAPTVLEKWADDVNANGGLKGHPIELVVKDDAGNATSAVTMVRELIEQDEVDAIVGIASLPETAWADYAAEQGVPVVGGLPFLTSFATNANFFTVGTNAFAQGYGLVAEAKEAGDTFGVLYCTEAPACATTSALVERFAPDLDVTIGLNQSMTSTQTNFTAVCQALSDSGAESFNLTFAAAQGIRILEACRQMGLEATAIATGGTADSGWLIPDGNGTLSVDLTAPFFDDSMPGTQAYREFLETNLPEVLGTNSDDPTLQYIYTSAKLFEAAIDALPDDVTEITPETIKQGLYLLEDETLGGLTAPLTFVEGEPTLVNCWFVSQIEDGEWTAPRGLETSCAPDDVIAEALAAQ